MLDRYPALSADHARLVSRLSEAERRAAVDLPTDDPLDPARRARVDHTRSEWLAQPEVVRRNWALNRTALESVVARIAAHRPERVVLVGAGDSLAALGAAQLALETALDVPCEPVQCLDAAYYRGAGFTPRSLVIALSSSGETTRTVEALLVAQAAGAMTLALTNKPQSTLARESTVSLLVEATRRGWPTQSSTAPLALLLSLAVELADRAGRAGTAHWAEQLGHLPDLMTQVIATVDDVIGVQAAAERDAGFYSFAGAGPNWATAVVGAAKVKECTPDHALAVQLEEFHHYNSLKAGEPLWLFVPPGPSIDRGVDTVHEAHRLGGHVHVLTGPEIRAFDGLARSVTPLPACDEAFSPLVYFLPAQLVGYHLAQAQFAHADG